MSGRASVYLNEQQRESVQALHRTELPTWLLDSRW